MGLGQKRTPTCLQAATYPRCHYGEQIYGGEIGEMAKSSCAVERGVSEETKVVRNGLMCVASLLQGPWSYPTWAAAMVVSQSKILPQQQSVLMSVVPITAKAMRMLESGLPSVVILLPGPYRSG